MLDSPMKPLKNGAPAPDPEVAATAKRRQFSSSEKRRILTAADRCSEAGEIGALLRREGIYSSQLATWRKQRKANERAALEPKKRGRKADPAIAETRRLAQLSKENDRLRQQLAQARTPLKGPAKWSCYHLYVILDIFSRYVVGWMIALREAAHLAEQLITDTVAKHNIAPNTLTLRADRGSSMRSKPVAALLVDLEIAKTHSRPHVSDDNPYSEAQFKTLNCRPDFPERFGSIEDARAHCQHFFLWYNTAHCHSGIGLMTPESVHYGHAPKLFKQRAETLNVAFLTNPKRFKGKIPQPPKLQTAAWINPPKQETAAQTTLDSSTLIKFTPVSQNH